MDEVRVLCCRADAAAAAADPAVGTAVAALQGTAIEYVGPRPGKDIDPILASAARVVVVGDDADLAAVALRLLRRELLGQVIIGYATSQNTAVTDLYSLPLGAAAARLATLGEPDLVSLVRNDVGGVLVGRGVLAPVQGTVYVDERRVLRGPASRLVVTPAMPKGLEVAVVPRRVLGIGRRPQVFPGRAVQIGTTAVTVVSDGVPSERPMQRWTFYKHTEPLRLVRGLI